MWLQDKVFIVVKKTFEIQWNPGSKSKTPIFI